MLVPLSLWAEFILTTLNQHLEPRHVCSLKALDTRRLVSSSGSQSPGDSIRKFLNRPPIHLLVKVKLETKPKKNEDRALVLTTWRIYLFGLKVPAKVECSFNVLEIRALNALNHNQILVETEKANYSLKFPTPESVDQVTRHVNTALAKIFPSPASVCLIRHGNVEAPETPRDMSPNSESSSSTTHSICGGFSETYAALCDYNGHCCREEVQWDVDTIYHSEDNREFNLLDFCHLESRDLALIVAALAYNQWFTKLYCKDLRLGSEVAEQVLHTVSKSHHLEELVLDNAGLKTDFALKLACVLAENPNTALHALTLSHNPLEDKGLSALSQQLLCFPKGLSKLCLSKTSITAKGLAILCQTFSANPAFTSSLRHLDLSKNPGLLGSDEANGFYSFLAQPNALVHLDLSSADCAVDALFGALLHGCCPRLSYLNLARNTFSNRKGKGLQPSLKQFFCSAYSLSYVNLSGIKMPVEALRSLFQGLSANTHLSELHMDLSGCELRSPGAQVLQEQLSGISALSSLDLSDNGFDVDLLSLVPALGKNKSLKHLWLGKNFNVKSRTLEEILQKMVQLIQEEECSLQSFSVADSRLKTRTSILINALGSNTCLTKVDLSGNCMEDIGAKMLSKALQINSTLRSISWDRNNTTAQGFQDIARALENNYTLKFMSFPMSDITAAYRNAPERTDEVWQKIQWCLLRNNHSQKYPQEQAFRLHQGIVTNSAEQMMSRLCVRVQEEVRVLRTCSADTVQEEVLYARELMKEAKNSRALFPSLYELGHILASDGPVRHRLESVANEVSKAVDKELQVILESMLALTQELCPHAVQAAEEHNKMLAAVSERVTVSRNFIRGALLEQAGQDIQNKLNEVKLSVVTYLTNTIVEELLQELYHAHKNLAQHITHLRHLSEGQDTAALPEQLGKPRLRDHEEPMDDELGSSIDTMAIKRQKNCRRIRPASAFISGSEQDGDLLAPRMGSPLGWISLANSSQYSRSCSTSFEALSDLPTEGTRLEHRTRSRPRPPRSVPHGSFHSSNRILASLESREQENGSVPQLDEGLDEFFNRRVLADNTSYPRTPKSCGVRPGPSDPLPALPKKRRRGLFHFRRHRSIKGERDPEDLPPSPPPPPPMGRDEQTPPLRPTSSQEEEKKPAQDILGMTVPLPGMGATAPGGGVKGLPSRAKQGSNPDVQRAVEPDARGVELLQPSRVQGVALPGMGRAKGWSLDAKLESVDLERGGSMRERQRRRSSDDSGQAGWRPQPPLQSTKPTFATIRRAEASWDIAEESSPRESWGKEPHKDPPQEETQSRSDERGAVATVNSEKDRLAAAAKQFREPLSFPRPPKPVALPRGRKPPSQPERSRSNEEAGLAGGITPEETRTSPPIVPPQRRPAEQERKGEPEAGRKTAPLKPKRTRRAQSCDKLDSDRGRNVGSGAPSFFRDSRIWDRMMDRRSLDVAAVRSCEALSSSGGKKGGM
ncbi:capping protein, Arp2/3 and myosin-I linker protein 3 isoform X3 [Hemicordylus capensis]|uniref:capping protein, Arp2/3 and myosin-I linker protein 3 isoform X3 n=1 Tax=Hemicordylus capensis TaxID=884348 RepID=UPI002302C080|nr:capping protein, Arp2/3 and myosin-I linker protein 3 isoform X3 [Hemicordylus capensis]